MTIPRALYRYFSFGPWVEKIINGEAVRFQSPLEFNDPFDGRPNTHANFSSPETEEYFHRVAKERGMGRAQRRRKLKELAERVKSTGGMGLIELGMLRQLMGRYGVLCLTPHHDDLLMWSHYGDGHKGLCIEFDSSRDFFRTAMPVIYQEEYPIIRIGSASDDEILNKSIFTKASCWKYEDEWRVTKITWSHEDRRRAEIEARLNWSDADDYRNLVEHRGSGDYSFNKTAVKGVLLGARIADNHKAQLIAWVGEHNPDVKIYQAKCHSHKYSLEFKELPR